MSEKKAPEQGPKSAIKDMIRMVGGEVPAKPVQRADSWREFGEPPPAIMRTTGRVEKGEVPVNIPAKPTQRPSQDGTASNTGTKPNSGSSANDGKK